MKAWWNGLGAEDRLKYRKYSIAAGFLALLLFVYYASGQDEKEPIKEVETTDLSLGTDLLEDDIRAKVDKDLKHVGETLAEMERRQRQYDSLLAALETSQNDLKRQGQGEETGKEEMVNPLSDFQAPESGGEVSYPEPPTYVPSYSASESSLNNIPVEARIVGGIGRAPGTDFQPETGSKKRTRSTCRPATCLQFC